MAIDLVVTCTFLGLLATGSAAGKLTKNPKNESLHGVGVADSQVKNSRPPRTSEVVGLVLTALALASTLLQLTR